MATQYNHSAIEKKWRENWEKHPISLPLRQRTSCRTLERIRDF